MKAAAWGCLARTILAYAVAAVVGTVGFWLNVPLSWILGPLVAAAALSIAGFDFAAPRPLRWTGQCVVGTTIGLNVTAAVAASLPGWIGVILLAAAVAVLVGAAFSVGFAKAAGVDQLTAFLALIPGGLAEMGTLAGTMGARADAVAVTQALRVAIVVLTVPPLLFFANGAVRVQSLVVSDPLPWFSIVALITAGIAVALLVRRLRVVNNPWAMGPLIFTATLTSTGVVAGHMPPPIFFVGQILLGFAIGALFRRDLIIQMPRVAAAAAVFVTLVAGTLAAFALLLAAATDLDVITAVLSTSPGGMSEMSATAQALHVGAALVAMFHVARAILINAFASHYWWFFSRVGFFNTVGRLAAGLGNLFRH